MGKTYPAEGMQQGVKALLDLARSPATAEHIAFKLVRHFITDEPTPAMVDPLKNEVHRDRRRPEGGGAGAAAACRQPGRRRSPRCARPTSWRSRSIRALGIRYKADEFWALSETLRALRQSLWECPSPEGYSDDTPYWLDPDGMTIRLDTALLSAWVYGAALQGRAWPRLATKLFDRALSTETRERIAGAGDKTYALTILFSSPEFQRR